MTDLAGRTRTERLVPGALLLLAAVPVLAGILRVVELSGGPAIAPADARFTATPGPVLVHVVCATTFAVLGAGQFAPRLRRVRNGWHRGAGRVVVVTGLAAALSGLWMTHLLPQSGGGLLTAFRTVFGTAMAASLVLGVVAIRRGDVTRHGAWITRGYAIGLGAGTQFVTAVAWTAFAGEPGEVTAALLMAAGWVINLAVAEIAIRRRPAGDHGA